MVCRLLSFGLLAGCTIMSSLRAEEPSTRTVRIGIAGLTHSHVHWLLGREDQGDVEIVGIAEPNRELAERYAKRYGLGNSLLFDDLDSMLEETKPEAVTAFGSIFEHLEVVESCAPQGIHVMVEKPLAMNLTHANRMAKLARKHSIHLLTNYETTWYPSNQAIHDLVHRHESLGDLRKIVVHSGHNGPVAINVEQEFLEWLIDPEKNGGGALVDFGCYGANLITWLQQGEEPSAVSCVTQQLNPEAYPLIEDEATIVLTYPNGQGIIQASWNWPLSRKDMEVYGTRGQAIAVDRDTLHIRNNNQPVETSTPLKPLESPRDDPFALLAAVVTGELRLKPTDLSSLENNLTVVRILDAAKRSAETGQTIMLDDHAQKTTVAKIKFCSVPVDDQAKALKFYTEIMGFKKKADLPLGEFRWLTVVSPNSPEEMELALEPSAFPATKVYQKALANAGIPFTAFEVDDLDQEYNRLKALGVEFQGPPSDGPTNTRVVLLNDTCGNLIMLYEP